MKRDNDRSSDRASDLAGGSAFRDLLEAGIVAEKLLTMHWAEFGLRQEEQEVLENLRNAIKKATGE